MPNLINVFRSSASSNASNKKKKMTDEERRADVARLLAGSNDAAVSEEKGDMEWGTCMVFTCLADCARGADGKDVKAVWAEEVVLVQWDET